MIILLLSVIITLISLSALLYFLRKSMKRTLYSYTNLGILSLMEVCVFLIFIILGYGFIFYSNRVAFPLQYLMQEIVELPQNFAMLILPIIVLLCLFVCVSNISLMIHEGVRLTNALGFFIGAFFIGGTLGAFAISNYVHESLKFSEILRQNHFLLSVHTIYSLFFMNLFCYFECIFIAFLIMSYIAAKHKPAYDKDYIIILGCSISKNGYLLPLLKARANRAIRFAWEQEVATGKPVYYVPSGGQGKDEVISEGLAMEMYLLSHGAEEHEVYAEKKSRNTYENFLLSKKIIHELNPHAKVAFSTTNYHIFRSGILARRAGLNIEGIASKTKWYFWPNGLMREFIGILAIHKRVHLRFILLNFTFALLLGILTCFFA